MNHVLGWLTLVNRDGNYLGNSYGLLEVSPSGYSESPGRRSNQIHCKWHHVMTGCYPMLSGVLWDDKKNECEKRGKKRWKKTTDAETQSSLI